MCSYIQNIELTSALVGSGRDLVPSCYPFTPTLNTPSYMHSLANTAGVRFHILAGFSNNASVPIFPTGIFYIPNNSAGFMMRPVGTIFPAGAGRKIIRNRP